MKPCVQQLFRLLFIEKLSEIPAFDVPIRLTGVEYRMDEHADTYGGAGYTVVDTVKNAS
jgi:hypothetical protein